MKSKDNRSRYRVDPALWAKEILGLREYLPGKIFTSMQEEICKAIVGGNVVVKSGNGLGKDYLADVLILWFLCTFRDSIVIATAPSSRQVKKIIWGGVTNMYERARVRLGGRMMSMELRFGPEWYGIGFTTKETNQMIGKFSGFHAKHHLIVVTEAQAVDEITFEQLEGVGVGKNVRWYVAGNPLMSSGYFWKLFKDRRVGNNFKKFSFSCYDSPNVIAGKELIPGMVTLPWVEDKEKKWGKESPLFQARVLGEFPLTSVSTLVSMDECLQARDGVEDDNLVKGKKCLAVDPARYGDDSSCFAIAEGGNVVYLEAESGKATTETERMSLELVNEHKIEVFTCDDGAMGAGIYDHVSEELGDSEDVQCMPFSFNTRPSDPKYSNIITEAYYVVCDLIRKGKVRLPDDDELFMQLCSRKYTFSKTGKIMLESKEDIKRRGMDSPDKADAVVMAVFTSISQAEYEAGAETFVGENDEEREERNLVELDKLTGYPERQYSDMFL